MAALTEPNGARLMRHLSIVWLAFSIGILFYSRNPRQWAWVIGLVFVALAGEALVLTRRGLRTDQVLELCTTWREVNRAGDDTRHPFHGPHQPRPCVSPARSPRGLRGAHRR
jgi:hypothetical protein